MRETDVINVSATGGSGYFALEVLQTMHGFEGPVISLLKIVLAGFVTSISIMAMIGRDSNGDGVPDVIENVRTFWRALRGKNNNKK